MPDVIHESEALQFVLGQCPALPTRRVGLADATWLVVAEPVVAGEDVPPFANSAVDGYAVIAADVATAPVELTVVGEVAAGAHTDRVLAAGEAIRIMTGAPVPAGADAMVLESGSPARSLTPHPRSRTGSVPRPSTRTAPGPHG